MIRFKVDLAEEQVNDPDLRPHAGALLRVVRVSVTAPAHGFFQAEYEVERIDPRDVAEDVAFAKSWAVLRREPPHEGREDC